jgi:acyl-CoA synthetase (AMP-forming)/AMP-acid ligase II
MNILDALRYHARMRPNDLAIIHGHGNATFLQLRNTVLAVAARLRDAGLDRQRPVAIYVTDPLIHLALILGAMREAIPSFSGHPNYDAPPTGISIGAYLCDRQMPFMSDAAVIPVDSAWLSPAQTSGLAPERRRFENRQSLARVIASSGTTGKAKAIGLSAELVDRRVELPGMIGEHRLFPSLSMIGVSGSLGFRHCLAHLRLGNVQIMPSGKLDAISAVKLHDVKSIIGSPAQLHSLLDVVERGTMRLPSLEQVRVTGSSIPRMSVVRVRSRLCSDLTGLYGSAEVSGIADAPADLLERIPGCAGFIQPWARVEIVDAAGNVLPAGAEGIVRIRSDVGVAKYLGDPPENSTAFKDGWFHPGDTGTMSNEGLLAISGRTAEIINTGGTKVSPDLINDFLAGTHGIAEAAAFGVDYPDRPTEIWAAVVALQPIDEQALIETCRKALGGRGPHRIVRVQRIPRNTMGKVITDELRRSVMSGA